MWQCLSLKMIYSLKHMFSYVVIAFSLQVRQVEYSLPTCMRRFVTMELVDHRSTALKLIIKN